MESAINTDDSNDQFAETRREDGGIGSFKLAQIEVEPIADSLMRRLLDLVLVHETMNVTNPAASIGSRS